MITLPNGLANFMKGQNLDGLKPFAFLFRNKWDSVNNKYALDTTPIDISGLIVKPNTLSMTLDVNEIAQYNANNVTLTLSDTKNYFIEGTPDSYFPNGYQLYGSRVVLYYGLNNPQNPYSSQVGYTVVGNPTIINGVASDLTQTDYIKLNSKVQSIADLTNMEVKSVFQCSALSNASVVFGIGAYNIKLSVRSDRKFYFQYRALSAPNALQTASSQAIDIPLNTDITAYLYYVKDTSARLVIKSGENILWDFSTNDITINGNNDFLFGTDVSYFWGKYLSIDFKRTYIKVNGEYWFNGAYFFYPDNYTKLFTGVIKDLPTYKPEQYQVDLKLVSPLEMLKDIEAKDFSDKVTGEELTFIETDSDGHKVYNTTGTGVGGFEAVYANGNKLFDGVDYEVEQLNALGLPAIVTIIKSDYYSSTITADYYTWKTGLTVEQIVAGLVALAGYNSSNEDIRNVVWNSSVRSQENSSPIATIGFVQNGTGYLQKNEFGNGYFTNTSRLYRYSYLPSNFKISLNVTLKSNNLSLNNQQTARTYFLGSLNPQTGIALVFEGPWYWQQQYTYPVCRIIAYKVVNGTSSGQTFVTLESKNSSSMTENLEIEKNGNTVTITGNNATATYTFDNDFSFGITEEWNEYVYCHYTNSAPLQFNSFELSKYEDENEKIKNNGILAENSIGTMDHAWDIISANINADGLTYNSYYRIYQSASWTDWKPYTLNSTIGIVSKKIQFLFQIDSGTTNVENLQFQYLSNSLVLQLVNLSGLTVLEALQDFALISGYEFGVDRQGVFFFKPRVASTTPTYVLDHSEVAKIDTVKRNLGDFFTKLTLTFAQVPLEFYANKGTRPTLVDKYGIINKEIDKPDIVNYDNPELAQAIGPQLLDVYSAFPNIIQATGKLNLALELGDIVSVRRNFNLIEPESATDYVKYSTQQTYYRACKITGMNYNFAKRQITYTLRDVSDGNNGPYIAAYGFPYDLPIELSKLKEE